MPAGVGLSVLPVGILGERVKDEGRGEELGGDIGRLNVAGGMIVEPRGEPEDTDGRPEIELLLRWLALSDEGGELGGEKASRGEL